MNKDQFWEIVERVHSASGGDMKTKCRLLADELRKLPREEVQSFDEHFSDCYYRAYTEDVWGAAYVINNGCGDDRFMDFRSTLISLGRSAFETAVSDADSLASFDIDPAWATYEGYQSVAYTVYGEMTGREIPRNRSHPKATTGTPFIEWEMSQRFPKLVAKYGYKDSDRSVEKEYAARQAKKQQIVAVVKTILLNAGIIPACGLIPPFRLVAPVLRTGHSPESTHRQYVWEPFDFDEGHFLTAVTQLKQAALPDLESRPDLQGIKLKLDASAPGIDTFDGWLRTLSERGLA